MLRIKAKNAKSKRALEEREPKAVENPKVTMLLRNSTANQVVTDILGDLASLKKPLCKFFKRKDTFRPFEEDSKIEFLCQKNDASLFAIGQHTKKRPNTITMGRMFDFHILDMFELSVDKYVPMEHCKMAVGSKPLMIFNGEEFEQKPDFKKLQNFLLDYFSGIKVNAINLAGLEVLISVTALNGKIYFRVYNIALKKSGSRLPKVELKSTGPSLDLVLGRVKEASPDVMKMALKRPAELKPKKIKNISHNPLGDKLGRVHVGKQDLTKLQTRKMKGLKRTLSEKKAEKRQKTETQD